ncbi:gamma-glutamyltransferase [Halococcus dombrowskii]|uniref:Gamma-glutamyltransferase n=1 Tax=Halococcus dombrowskii TaxID=179637 RepID=A0AAX3AQX5_HALDO|nr:gamma-glutamyltransferase [Halococcus dombrowskii]UOO95480.1 gamma-glutamyltransferase [Halococcus dombrowskii]
MTDDDSQRDVEDGQFVDGQGEAGTGRSKTRRRTFLKGSAVALGAGAFPATADRATAHDDESDDGDRVDRVETATSGEGMVASSDPRASSIGADVLDAGGNAVDAAVAVQFALNVVQPHTSGIGGGGFMLVYDAGEDELYSVDNRERAPFGATPDMFLNDDGEPIPFDERITLGQAVGVPGTLKACDIALKRFGTREIADLIEPAIDLAGGARVDYYLGSTIEEEYEKFNDAARSVFAPGGTPLAIGDQVEQPDLAATFETIAEEGVGALYKGSVSEAVADVVQENGGSMTAADLGAYNVTIDTPEYVEYGDVTVRTQPLPSSGGLTIAHILSLLEPFDLAGYDRQSVELYRLLAEAYKLAYADRGEYMGDKQFVDAPWQGLLDEEYLGERRATIEGGGVTTEIQQPGDPWSYQPGDPYAIDPLTVDDVSQVKDAPRPYIPSPRGSTTHFTVADSEGNMVSWTSTIEQLFGSGIMVPDHGFMLNNEITDFDAEPGGPNEVQPLKRPLSSTSPTIVFRDGNPLFTVGSPGGTTIITTVAEMIINLVDFDMDLAEAVAEPRLYANSEPAIYPEASVPGDVQQGLRGLGYELAPFTRLGNVMTIRRDPETGEYTGAADFRNGGATRGV